MGTSGRTRRPHPAASLFPQLFLCFSATGSRHGEHDDFATRLFDLLAGRRAEPMRGDLELLRQFAVAEDLQHVAAGPGQILGAQRLGGDLLAGLERPVPDRSRSPTTTTAANAIVETAFRDAPDQGHRAALERRLARRSRRATAGPCGPCRPSCRGRSRDRDRCGDVSCALRIPRFTSSISRQ